MFLPSILSYDKNNHFCQWNPQVLELHVRFSSFKPPLNCRSISASLWLLKFLNAAAAARFLLVKSPIFGGCLAPKLLTSRSPSYRPLCFTKGSLGTWHPIPCCWARRGPDSVSNKRSCDRKVVLSQEPIDQLVLFFLEEAKNSVFVPTIKST